MNNMRNRTQKMILVSLFAALTAIGALLKISLPPVPFTLQIFFVVLSGLLLGSKLGFTSQVIYIALGLMGIPVFTDGGGLGYILSYKFGYLMGFAVSAYVSGIITERWASRVPSFRKYFIASLVGLLACYIVALPYALVLSNLYFKSPLAINILFGSFLAVFLPGDIVKMVLCAMLAVEVTKRIRLAGIMI